MARREGLTFLGSLPVDTELVTLLDAAEVDQADIGHVNGGDFRLLQRYVDTSSAKLFQKILGRVLETLGTKSCM